MVCVTTVLWCLLLLLLYAHRPIQASYASVITPGDPIKQRPPIPLENLPAGTFDPLYRFSLDVQNGELPVLPLSISGAVSMTHVPGTEQYLSGDEWFIFKFDKQQVCGLRLTSTVHHCMYAAYRPMIRQDMFQRTSFVCISTGKQQYKVFKCAGI
jgi:hypothetical protein